MSKLTKILTLAFPLLVGAGCTNQQLEQQLEYHQRTTKQYKKLIDSQEWLNKSLEQENEQMLKQLQRIRKIDKLKETYPRPRKQPNTITI